MSDSDHQVFSELLDQGDVSASDEVLAGCVLEALRPYGFDFQHNNFATNFHRTDYRVDRFLNLRESDGEGRISAAIRTMGLPEGQVVVSLVLFTCTGPMASMEPCQHVELFRSETVDNWRSTENPVETLRYALLQAGFLDDTRWPAVAATAAEQVDLFLQP